MNHTNSLSQVVTHADRAVTDETWIIHLLHRGSMGMLSTAITTEDGAAQPFISTLLYVLDENQRSIYLHAARRGRIWENVQRNDRVCLCVAEMGRLLPAAQALNFSVEYASVVVFGRMSLVQEPQEAEKALQMTLDKYFPHLKSGQDYRAIIPAELSATAVYRMQISEWSGKKKEVASDFPGAFLYPHPAE